MGADREDRAAGGGQHGDSVVAEVLAEHLQANALPASDADDGVEDVVRAVWSQEDHALRPFLGDDPAEAVDVGEGERGDQPQTIAVAAVIEAVDEPLRLGLVADDQDSGLCVTADEPRAKRGLSDGRRRDDAPA
jgi:hypothetical protein